MLWGTAIDNLLSFAIAMPDGRRYTVRRSDHSLRLAMRARKRDAFQATFDAQVEERIVLTNCPSCLSGLERNQSLGVRTRHMAEALAMGLDGQQWLEKRRPWRERAQVVTF